MKYFCNVTKYIHNVFRLSFSKEVSEKKHNINKGIEQSMFILPHLKFDKSLYKAKCFLFRAKLLFES